MDVMALVIAIIALLLTVAFEVRRYRERRAIKSVLPPSAVRARLAAAEKNKRRRRG